MKINSTYKYFLLTFLSLVLLSACNKPMEAPEVVLKNSKEATLKVDSGKVMMDIALKGEGDSDNIDFKGGATLAFSDRKEKEKKMDLSFNLSGLMKSADKSVNGDVDFQIINIGHEYYVKLNKLTSNDESLVSVEPFINQYKEKWLRIAEDFIPESIRNLQSKDEASELKQKQLEDIFLETNFFTVAKEYGVEKVDGQKVYHYALTPNKDEFKTYMSKASLLDGQSLTEAELEQAVAFLDNLKTTELFIDTSDYTLKKAIFNLSGTTEVPGSTLDIQLTLTSSDFNESVSIEAPKAPEDFNPLNLIMGLGSLPGAPTDSQVPVTTGGENGGGATPAPAQN